MILCVCNGLSETAVRSALSDHASTPTVSDAYRACGCARICGTCAAEMRAAVKAERARRASLTLGAD
jgi:bacterioferritin-associated ferredoxin